MQLYKLSAVLEGHEDDVRSVASGREGSILSASRDATVRRWNRESGKEPPHFDCSVSSVARSFVNTVGYLQPNKDFPEGFIISGGQDSLIEVRLPLNSADDDAHALLVGHTQNVCSLDISPDGSYIVSGSWDSTARVWSVGTWNQTILAGHEGSVWAVLAYDADTVITGCADHYIRVYHSQGKQIKEFEASKDVVRALCRLSSEHASGGQLASAGNDTVIHVWTLDGVELTQLHGHTSFIYSLSCFPDGRLVSSGEDRTVRIWNSASCIQTITHPAISVWSITICRETGDIISGASDKKIRVFTQVPARYASQAVIKDFEKSVEASEIPQEQVGKINKNELPDSGFLTRKSGTKDGQVQMIRENNGSITAYQWSLELASWTKIGTVVDTEARSGHKVGFHGKDYDYVFDVDIEDGKPALKLPYNLSQNPYEAAAKFIEDNELPSTYLAEVAEFIIKNAEGTPSDQPQSTVQSGPDVWGTESRYRPGDAADLTSQSMPIAKGSGSLPQKSPLSIKTGNTKMILSKISQFNILLKDEGSSDLCLDATQMSTLRQIEDPLNEALSTNSLVKPVTFESANRAVHQMLKTWPSPYLLPVLDLTRLLASTSASIATRDLFDSILSQGFEDVDRQNNIMMAIRALANYFEHDVGKELMLQNIERVLNKVATLGEHSSNRSLDIAIATLYLNYAVTIANRPFEFETHLQEMVRTLYQSTIRHLESSVDVEASYRNLVAIGTLISGKANVNISKEDLKSPLSAILTAVRKRTNDSRIHVIVREIQDLL